MLKTKSLTRKCVINIALFHFLSELPFYPLHTQQISHLHARCLQMHIISTFKCPSLLSDFNQNCCRLLYFSKTTNLMKTHFLFFMLQADSQADMLKIQVFWTWYCATGKAAADISKDHSAIIFSGKLHSEHKSTRVFQNARNYTAPQPQRHKSWAKQTCEPQTYCYCEAKRHLAKRYEDGGCKQH